MIRAYKYIFYKLYRLETFLFDTAPEYSALFGMVILEALNIGLVIALVEWWTGIRFVTYPSRTETACILIVLVLPQYFFLVHRENSKISSDVFPQSLPGSGLWEHGQSDFTSSFRFCCFFGAWSFY